MKLFIFYRTLYLLFNYSSIQPFNVLELIMLKNFVKELSNTSMQLRVSYITLAVLTHHNKMVWWNENTNTSLIETARALFFQSNLPISYWGECILTAAYLLARMPLSSLRNTSPYAKLYNKDPDISHIRAFGCLCFVSTLKQGRNKFHPRATPHIFLGYSFTQKGYKVLNLSTHKIHVSRDAKFFEKHFPYHHNPSPILLPPPQISKSFFPSPLFLLHHLTFLIYLPLLLLHM